MHSLGWYTALHSADLLPRNFIAYIGLYPIDAGFDGALWSALGHEQSPPPGPCTGRVSVTKTTLLMPWWSASL